MEETLYDPTPCLALQAPTSPKSLPIEIKRSESDHSKAQAKNEKSHTFTTNFVHTLHNISENETSFSN
jgi:hypothetical protein